MSGVSAFSRKRERMRQLEMAEVAAMEDLLADPQFEDAEGDLEDDFVVAATQVDKGRMRGDPESTGHMPLPTWI